MDGTASGAQTPPQQGVITREHENFPWIPPKLLKLSPEELQTHINRLHKAIFADDESLWPNMDRQDELADSMVLYEFAKTAVERKLEAAQT